MCDLQGTSLKDKLQGRVSKRYVSPCSLHYPLYAPFPSRPSLGEGGAKPFRRIGFLPLAIFNPPLA